MSVALAFDQQLGVEGNLQQAVARSPERSAEAAALAASRQQYAADIDWGRASRVVPAKHAKKDVKALLAAIQYGDVIVNVQARYWNGGNRHCRCGEVETLQHLFWETPPPLPPALVPGVDRHWWRE